MRHFKVFDDDGFIIAAGVGEGGVEINVFEYNRIHSLFVNAPTNPGIKYKLNKNYTWEGFELDREKLPDEEIREIFQDEILHSIEIQQKPTAIKEGYILKQVYDAIGHRICWEYAEDPNAIKEPQGTYTDPISYSQNMTVTTNLWYTDGDNIWEAIQDGVPASFEDTEYFDIIN